MDEEADYSVDAIHLVRTAQLINMSLSQMADQKASMLMGATFLVFTLCVGQAASGPAPALIVLGLFSFLSAVLAVMTVMPAIGVRGHAEPNLLFFGAFAQMDEASFIAAIKERVRDQDALLATMIRDIYQNGRVLQRKKYRFLGYAYRTFLAGLGLTLVTFVADRLV